jgi:hypothetical protein
MNYADYRPEMTVWVTNGQHKGKKGRIVSKGWGMLSVALDNLDETVAFGAESLTNKDPLAQTVPLPPNFIPTEFKLGDVVEVTGHSYSHYNGIRGEVVRLPTSTSYRNGGDRRYQIKVTGKGRSDHRIGNDLFFEGAVLAKYVKPERVEGQEISHDDVKIGDEIKVEIVTTTGRYKQSSMKQGKVTSITKRLQPTGDAHIDYAFRTSDGIGWSGPLNFGAKEEKITLIKIAEDPFIAIVNGLAAGTVVILEKDSGEVLSFVKSKDYGGSGQWHKVSSLSSYSSTFVDDRDIIDLLNNGAEIVHKVRKPVPVPF